jgi:hypothetical protein
VSRRSDPKLRRRAILSGLLVAAAYVAGALVTGRIDPLAKRPIFDGFAPPPPYRWVSPPPSLANGNQKPDSGTARVRFGAKGTSTPVAAATRDLQASLILSGGAFPPMPGQQFVQLRIQPLAPPASGTPLSGLRVAGNVYLFAATYEPGGPSVTSLSKEAQLTLVAPTSVDGLIHRHALLFSSDQRSWQVIPSSDAITQVGGNVRSLGYYAVGEYVAGAKKKPFPVGKVIQYALVGALVLLVVIPILVHEVRTRRSRASKSARQKSSQHRRRR